MSAGSVFPELAAVWQCDGGKMVRVWPSHRAGRLTVSGPSWRAEDRQEWKKCFEVATHPSTVRGEQTRARENAGWWQTGTDQSLDSSSSSSDHHPQQKERKDEGRGSERGEATAVSYFEGRGQGQRQGWRKGRILTAWAWGEEKIKSALPLSEMCQHSGNGRALILKINVIAVVCPYARRTCGSLDGFTT